MAERAPEEAAAFDPRVTPMRPGLGGQPPVVAHPRDGRAYEVAEPAAPLRHAPSPDAPLDTEALKGERVTVYETTDEGWAWGRLEADSYVGFIPIGALRDPGPAPTHKVAALRTLVFPGPSIKLPPVETLALGCRLAIVRDEPPFAVTAAGGYVPARHLATLDSSENDFVAVAERFLGAPYLWGGKPILASTARAWCRLRSSRAERPARVTATCKSRPSGRRLRTGPIFPPCSAATCCSGKAMSPLCAIKRRSFTPTPFTCRSPLSRSPRQSHASARKAAG